MHTLCRFWLVYERRTTEQGELLNSNDTRVQRVIANVRLYRIISRRKKYSPERLAPIERSTKVANFSDTLFTRSMSATDHNHFDTTRMLNIAANGFTYFRSIFKGHVYYATILANVKFTWDDRRHPRTFSIHSRPGHTSTSSADYPTYLISADIYNFLNDSVSRFKSNVHPTHSMTDISNFLVQCMSTYIYIHIRKRPGRLQ